MYVYFWTYIHLHTHINISTSIHTCIHGCLHFHSAGCLCVSSSCGAGGHLRCKSQKSALQWFYMVNLVASWLLRNFAAAASGVLALVAVLDDASVAARAKTSCVTSAVDTLVTYACSVLQWVCCSALLLLAPKLAVSRLQSTRWWHMYAMCYSECGAVWCSVLQRCYRCSHQN